MEVEELLKSNFYAVITNAHKFDERVVSYEQTEILFRYRLLCRAYGFKRVEKFLTDYALENNANAAHAIVGYLFFLRNYNKDEEKKLKMIV